MKYFSEQAVATLRKNVTEHIDWYYNPEGEPPKAQGVKRPIRESGMLSSSLCDAKLDFGDESDAQNAVTVYQELCSLRPQEASDERLWTYLCHFQCANYVAKRWLSRRPENTNKEKADTQAERKICNHFFAAGNRAIIRNNGLSRLWWLGYIAREVDRENPYQFLEILLHKKDIPLQLIGRPSISMNLNILRAIYTIMEEHWDQDKGNALLFKRNVFRDWMIRLNRKGGVILMDALSPEMLDELLREEANASRLADRSPDD